jgi:hypothetical protein
LFFFTFQVNNNINNNPSRYDSLMKRKKILPNHHQNLLTTRPLLSCPTIHLFCHVVLPQPLCLHLLIVNININRLLISLLYWINSNSKINHPPPKVLVSPKTVPPLPLHITILPSPLLAHQVTPLLHQTIPVVPLATQQGNQQLGMSPSKPVTN